MAITGLNILLFIYALVVLALLLVELLEYRRAQFFFKPLAALGFILLALQFGATESRYGYYILAGLIACALGDVLLLARNSEKLFMAGIAAFAIGHVLYLIAFLFHPTEIKSEALIVIMVVTALICLGVYRWIKPNLSEPLKFGVGIYIAIIYSMVFFAFQMDVSSMRFLAPIAAIMFAISDMFVARDRFVKPDPKNALAITPLYFGAQALFALSVST